jgi:hypothetical protein
VGGVQVCPLILIITENFPTGLAKELTEIGIWFMDVYGSSPKELSEVWTELIKVVNPCHLWKY